MSSLSADNSPSAHDLLDALAVAVRDAVQQIAARRSDAVPRIALTPFEAAESLGCSAEFFRIHVDPELPWIRRGRKRFVGLAALEAWAVKSAERTL